MKEDKMKAYAESNQIKTLHDFVKSKCPPGFILEKHKNTAILFHKLERCPSNNVPEVTATIMIDEALHVKLLKKVIIYPVPSMVSKRRRL